MRKASDLGQHNRNLSRTRYLVNPDGLVSPNLLGLQLNKFLLALMSVAAKAGLLIGVITIP